MNQVISTLNLTKARETIIGGPLRRGVSGGERKRSVGHERFAYCLILTRLLGLT
jgi:hypothetical protein